MNIPRDKLLHMAAGFFVACVTAAATSAFKLAPALQVAALAAAPLAVGIAKEAWDNYQNNKAIDAKLPPPHSVELADVLATALPGFAMAALFYIVRG